MRKTLNLFGVVAVLFLFCEIQSSLRLHSTFAAGPIATYRKLPNGVLLPDKSVTPGDVDPSLTADKLCDPKFHTGTVRAVTEAMKKQVFAEYGVVCGKGKSRPCSEFEIDHDISLELGGSNSIKNLWPQPAEPRPGFHEKDDAEGAAHRFVCSGSGSQRTARLHEMQSEIAENWYDLYVRLVPAKRVSK